MLSESLIIIECALDLRLIYSLESLKTGSHCLRQVAGPGVVAAFDDININASRRASRVATEPELFLLPSIMPCS